MDKRKKIKGNRIEIYPHKCTGCHLCEVACSFSRYHYINPDLSKIRILNDNSDGEVKIEISSFCSSCVWPVCQEFCATDAIKIVVTEYNSLSL